ncbi:hypothetical protein P171DRAFT_122123 [Karstenula rhodostoma CBS 690.94]|uniref:Uncharacterized protein n=1 Tax=Karstenula rhodostoma CBS 690.94 TaxID=1392251 RepID=A0A9P4U7Q9_9PLEO|nr:hypothetical protein P171DRAFT_122123 [Karstenula rhodostoma CBS 690.94]
MKRYNQSDRPLIPLLWGLASPAIGEYLRVRGMASKVTACWKCRPPLSLAWLCAWNGAPHRPDEKGLADKDQRSPFSKAVARAVKVLRWLRLGLHSRRAPTDWDLIAARGWCWCWCWCSTRKVGGERRANSAASLRLEQFTGRKRQATSRQGSDS